MWWEWRTNHTLPTAGGWLDQPLDLLAKISAYETVYMAYTSNDKRDGPAFDKLNATQAAALSWIEADYG